MPTLKVQIVINKGERGVPLNKLAQIVGDVQQFLLMISQDLNFEVKPKSWVGLDFENGSLLFTAEKTEDVSQQSIEEFNSTFTSISEKRPNAKLRRATVAQYAKIADPIDPEEAVSFGLYAATPLIGNTQEESVSAEFFQLITASAPVPLRWVDLTKAAALEIKSEIQGKVRAYGSLQGKIHSLFLGSQPAYFNLRELSSGTLIKCVYKPAVYTAIAAALQRMNAVLHVYGYTTTDLVDRKLEEMEVDRVDLAPFISDEDFANLFGADPSFTGRLTTQEFINFARGRAQ